MRPGRSTTANGAAGGARWPDQLLVLLLLLIATHTLMSEAQLRQHDSLGRPLAGLAIPLSTLVAWRWGWALLHWIRSALYRFWRYPRLRAEAARAVALHGPVPEVALLVATYKERAEITHQCFRSIVLELGQLSGLRRRPLLVAVTGCDDDDRNIIQAVAEAAKEVPEALVPEIHLLRGANGKRDALAQGLERIIELGIDPAGAFAMMDGDTHLEPGALVRSLPLLRLDKRIGALTTDEHVMADGPAWFAEWLHLRHGLRDLYACSISLSGRLLCLTGRFSIFRAAVLDRSFISIIRSDHVDNWLWGRYALLSGDDKSTWFHLLKQDYRLLYVPDAHVVTHEVVTNSALVRTYHNLRRWGGNMVRNNGRAISIGPRRLGLFTWWCLVDQRISIWTTLIGPMALITSVLADRWDLAAAYLLWVLVSRVVRTLPAWLHGRRISFFYGPLSAVLDWVGALVKMWIWFFPARQFWHNRGNRQLDSTAGSHGIRDRRVVAALLLGTAAVTFVLGVAQLTGTVLLGRDLKVLQATRHGLSAVLAAGAFLVFVVGLAIAMAFKLRPPHPISSDGSEETE